MAKKNLALTIVIAVFLIAMITVFTNLTIRFAYPPPEFSDFCDEQPPKQLFNSEQECVDAGGEWIEFAGREGGSCDLFKQCREAYDDVRSDYERNVFFMLAGFGFALILTGMFVPQFLIQTTSLSTGSILVIEAMIRYHESQLLTILTLALIIILTIIFAIRKLKD